MTAKDQPTFSIVVPTHNRPQQLTVLLRSLARLQYPHDCFEVVIVDDGSRSSPAAILAPYQETLQIVMLSQQQKGPANARQAGVEVAQGEYLAFTDDDCVPQANWLQCMAKNFKAEPHCALGGRTINALPANPYSTASQLLISYLYEYYNRAPQRAQFFTTNNMALPAHGLKAIGGIDASWRIAGGEDRDLCHRWLRHGCPMKYVPEMVVCHYHHLNFPSFWRQHFHYGRGAFRFRSKWRRGAHGGLGLEPVSFYLNLPRYGFSQTKGRRALSVAALLVVSQAANAAGFFWERARGARSTRHGK